jgi:hypothetical protein
MNTNTRSWKKRAPQLCLLLLGAALVLAAVVTLTAPAETDNILSNNSAREELVQARTKSETQKRDFVELRDIELVGTPVARSDPPREERIRNGLFDWPFIRWPYLHAGEGGVGGREGGGVGRSHDHVRNKKSNTMLLCEVSVCSSPPVKRCEARRECAAYDNVPSVIFYDDSWRAAGLCTLLTQSLLTPGFNP